MQNTNENIFLRSAIFKGVHGQAADRVAEAKWGAASNTARYIKAAVSPMTAGQDASGVLTIGNISREQFVQAVYSQQIIGQLAGITRVPAITRINFEAEPSQASFVLEGNPLPFAVGNVGVVFPDKRKIGMITMVSDELLQLTDDSAEATLQGIITRAVSRGVDAVFVGSQARDETNPAGLASVATQVSESTLAAAFSAGVEAFTGDLKKASVLVNPLTAVSLRSPTETQITAYGGVYGGLNAVTSYGVPVNTLFVVDASRVVAAFGDVDVVVGDQATVYPVPQSSGDVQTSAFQTSQRAVRCIQYVDWQFLPGAAVQASLAS
jgi:hypothetical protein